MARKHQAPEHIKINQGNLPKSDLKIFKILHEVPDPRQASCNFKHPLPTILFITLVCSFCDANNFCKEFELEWRNILIENQNKNHIYFVHDGVYLL